MGLELGAACVIRRGNVAAYQKQMRSTKSVQDQTKPSIIYTYRRLLTGSYMGFWGLQSTLEEQSARESACVGGYRRSN
jgi:hypothetical protein